jgi:hypothetical protein
MHRKAAIRLLRRAPRQPSAPARAGRPRCYGPHVAAAAEVLWQASGASARIACTRSCRSCRSVPRPVAFSAFGSGRTGSGATTSMVVALAHVPDADRRHAGRVRHILNERLEDGDSLVEHGLLDDIVSAQRKIVSETESEHDREPDPPHAQRHRSRRRLMH